MCSASSIIVSHANDGDVVRVSRQRLQVMGIGGEHGSSRFSECHD